MSARGGRLHDVVKAYDVRGLVPEELDDQVVRAVASAFAQVVVLPDEGRQVIVGHDMRDSSPALAAAFADGVREHGLDVLLIGLCSTDGLYYASGSRDQAAAMITASHNPSTYNGIKLCRRGARPVGQDSGLGEIRDLAQWILERGSLHALPAAARQGEVREEDLLGEYAAHLHSLVDVSAIRPLRVVVDAGNGMAGLTAPAVLHRPGLALQVDPLYLELDGSFPHHEPNPLDPTTLRDLQAAVRDTGADLGLAFDGDADRCVVVDERGEPVDPSVITALVAAREVAKEVQAGRAPQDVVVVHGVICSRVVPEVIEELGATAVRSRVGHSFVKAQMAEHEAVFGGEHSAHYYFRDFWFADSGMLAALHVIAALGEQPGPLSELVARYQRYSASGEVNSRVHDVGAATDRVRAWGLAQGAWEDDVEGLMLVRDRDDHDGEAGSSWWVSLRPSNTEPLLRLNVEASDSETMARVRNTVLALVRQEAP